MRVIRPGYDGDDVTAFQLFLCEQGMTQLVPDGVYAPAWVRVVRAFQAAHGLKDIDLNVRWNRLKTVPALKGHLGSVRELVPVANACGLYWGGHFSRLDGVHFELAE